MPFQIIRDDITHISADIIVNSANPHPIIGSGVDAAIHMAAGPRLIEARKKIGEIAEGEVRYSRAFDLRARYVVHAVGPDCRKEQQNMEEKLRACYTKTLQLAQKLYCESVAFPLISAGVYDCPKEQALQIAVSAISDFLKTNEMDVTLVVYDPESYVLSTQVFDEVKAYVDEHYVETAQKDAGIGQLEESDLRKQEYVTNRPQRKEGPQVMAGDVMWSIDTSKELSAENLRDLEDEAINNMEIGVLHQEVIPPIKLQPGAETFSQMLLRLVDKTGKKDPEIYLKAGQTRQLFSKIRTQRNYQPSKNTVLSFAFALELNMDQTLDLLKSAGYTLSDGIKLDLAVRYFFEKGIYDLYQIKITLFGMDIEF
jgi:O-acetyl-ADP-ribose deacetylase